MLQRVRLRLRSLVLRRRLEREMREEMAEHLERATARLTARGLAPEAARRQAEREFGNVVSLREQGREARGTAWLDALLADVRFALRHFARSPWTTLTMLVVLAIGMSVSTLLFSFVYGYAVQPPPGIELEADLVRIRGSRDAGPDGRVVRTFTEEEFRAYGELRSHFRAVAGWTNAAAMLQVGGRADGAWVDAAVEFVTESYFPVIGVRPVRGPGLSAAASGENASALVVVIGHSVWDRLYGRDPGAIGKALTVNGVPMTIVGVAPKDFGGIGNFREHKVWLPLASQRLVAPGPGDFRAIARLQPGVSARAATAAAQLVAARFADAAAADDSVASSGAGGAADGARWRLPSTEVVPLLSSNGDADFESDVAQMSLLFGLLGLLVLAVTCTNASALLTGLATARRHEIAVRLSLGAGRTRLIRQLLTESALVATFSAAAALGIAWAVLRAVMAFVAGMPLELGIHWPVTAFTFGVALAVGILFGLSPALHATRLALAAVLRDSSATIAATRARLQRGLVVAQVAFTQPLIVLLATTLLLVMAEFEPRELAGESDRVLAISIRLAAPAGATAAAMAAAEQRLRVAMLRARDRVAAVPGVEAVSTFRGSGADLGPYVAQPAQGAGEDVPAAARLLAAHVDGDYFGVIGIPLVRGRTFTAADHADPAAGAELPTIVDADLARHLWGGADPIGRRLLPATDSAADRTLVVVGVADVSRSGRAEPGEYRVWLPADTAIGWAVPLIRTVGPAAPLIPTVRAILAEEAPGQVTSVSTFAQAEAEQLRQSRRLTGSVSAAGALALLLSAIGLYAVVAFSVGQRTREIAIRIAVGGARSQIVRRFVADGLRLSAFGMVIGLPISLIGLHLVMRMPDIIPQVALPSVTAIAAGGVLLVATAAVWIPSRRAASVDPAVTLRAE
jgi:predicted permease